jgi:serine/threonine-protein kinase
LRQVAAAKYVRRRADQRGWCAATRRRRISARRLARRCSAAASMGLLDSFKGLLRGNKVDLRARFELQRESITGTMSKFYVARERATGQTVGVKIIDPKKLADFEARLRGLKRPTEGEITAKFDHPRIVRLIEHGVTTENEQYLVMEYLTGQGLNNLIVTRDRLLDGRRIALIRQMAEALAAVHKAEYIHRDVCPRNLIVDPDGQSLKLIDFGLSIPATPEFMQPGNRTGNPNYMAPELIKRMPTDHRVDVFAFGITAYETCTFELPWTRGIKGDVAMQHAAQAPQNITRYRPRINPKLGNAIMSCLEQDPARRCASMEQFLKLIRGVEREDD